MNSQQANDTAAALEKALVDIPRGARGIRALLNTRAREYRRAARLYDRALDHAAASEIDIVPAGSLERGEVIMTSVGPRRIVTFSATGIGYSDAGLMAWENRDGTSSPFVALPEDSIDE